MSDAQKCPDCGAVHEWTATEQPDGSYVVSVGDTTTSLVSASACGFSKSQARRVGYMLCKCICLERQLAQAREENARLREVVDLCAIWFEVDDEERKSMGGDDRMREALAASGGQEGEKAERSGT